MNKKTEKILLYVSAALTAAICLIMNFVLIPKIESSTGGIRCFDMNFAYSFDTAKKFLSLLSDEGRSVYLGIQLPLDFIYPIAYCTLFILVLLRLSDKKAFCALPVLLAVFDYAENVCSIIMLKSAELSPALVGFASVMTSAKTVLMYVIILIIIVLWVIKTKNRKTQH